jgi:hypothetical protein
MERELLEREQAELLEREQAESRPLQQAGAAEIYVPEEGSRNGIGSPPGTSPPVPRGQDDDGSGVGISLTAASPTSNAERTVRPGLPPFANKPRPG